MVARWIFRPSKLHRKKRGSYVDFLISETTSKKYVEMTWKFVEIWSSTYPRNTHVESTSIRRGVAVGFKCFFYENYLRRCTSLSCFLKSFTLNRYKWFNCIFLSCYVLVLSESTLYTCLNVKETLAQNRREWLSVRLRTKWLWVRVPL